MVLGMNLVEVLGAGEVADCEGLDERTLFWEDLRTGVVRYMAGGAVSVLEGEGGLCEMLSGEE